MILLPFFDILAGFRIRKNALKSDVHSLRRPWLNTDSYTLYRVSKKVSTNHSVRVLETHHIAIVESWVWPTWKGPWDIWASIFCAFAFRNFIFWPSILKLSICFKYNHTKNFRMIVIFGDTLVGVFAIMSKTTWNTEKCYTSFRLVSIESSNIQPFGSYIT